MSDNDVTLAAVVNGKIEVWGGNDSGQLGNGTTTKQDTPQQVPGFEQGLSNTVTYIYNGEGLRTSNSVGASPILRSQHSAVYYP